MYRTLFVLCLLATILAVGNGCTCYVVKTPRSVTVNFIGAECRENPALYVMNDLQLKRYYRLKLEADTTATDSTWIAEQVNTNATALTFGFLPAYPYGYKVESIEWRFSDEPKRWTKAVRVNERRFGQGFRFNVPNRYDGYRQVELVAIYQPSCGPTPPEERIVQRFLIPVKLQATNCGLKEP
ncbi:MAG: hypothetical protein WC497_00900 [Patescibacteria group bacterium]